MLLIRMDTATEPLTLTVQDRLITAFLKPENFSRKQQEILRNVKSLHWRPFVRILPKGSSCTLIFMSVYCNSIIEKVLSNMDKPFNIIVIIKGLYCIIETFYNFLLVVLYKSSIIVVCKQYTKVFNIINATL